MRRSLSISFAMLVFSFSLLAQEERVAGSVAEPQDPTPGAETSSRELPVLRSGRGVTSNVVVDGSFGDVVLNGSDTNYPTAGILLRAGSGTGHPNVIARLGGSDATSHFSVFNWNHIALLRVDGTGAVGIGTATPAADFHLYRGDAFTTMRVEHTAAGTSTASRGARVQFYENGTLKAALASAGSGSTAATGGANALQLWNYANGALLLATNNTERMRVHADGRIGIGITSQPGYLLHAQSNTDSLSSFGAQMLTTVEANTLQNDTAAHTNVFQNVLTGINNTGAIHGLRVGAYLDGAGTLKDTYGAWVRTGVYAEKTGTVEKATGLRVQVISGAGTVDMGIGIQIPDVPATTQYAILQEGTNDLNLFHGPVRVGGNSTRAEKLVVTGDAYVTGTLSGTNIKAHYQDLAEWVPADADLAPGTVVVLHPERPNEVISSARAYDTSVAGVVSAQPGIILGEGGEGKEQIATTGRVKVRVDARKTPIRIGDLLVTSDVPGTAMRSESIELGGHQFHRPGTIVGKALEAIDGRVGEILVLLSLQ
jgi:hypothetical protein